MNHNAASDGIGWEPGSCVWTRRNLKTTLPLNRAKPSKLRKTDIRFFPSSWGTRPQKAAWMPCKSTVSRGGNSTAITSPQAGVKPELPSDHYRPAPAPGSSVTGKSAHCQVTPSISLACCTTTEQENAVFSMP